MLSVYSYYSVSLKEDRLKRVDGFCQTSINKFKTCGNFEFVKMELSDRSGIAALFKGTKFDDQIFNQESTRLCQ